MTLLSLCDLDAPIWLIIWWFLPFLLGLLLGYLIWSRWKSRFEEKETELGEANLRITELDSSLRSCEAKKMELDNELVLLRSEIREMKEKTDITNKTERVFKGEEPSSGADPSSQSITQSSGKGSASIYSALSEKNL
ncbi:MAG: hypothetical protein R3275_07955, partial [Saprospiraceae bacterium]|nr:hypothetical protein [Saprospiraceae bacterium]